MGLITGSIYTWLSLTIRAPNVLGGILAIIGTFVGFIAVSALQGQPSFAT